jgi:SAM-dependent methyltransferase
LDLIGAVAPARESTIVDIGGGASLLVDYLLDRGYCDVMVVDVSAAALDAARTRLGLRADVVTWIVADARYVRLPRQVDLWHDRAVFHFLTDEVDRQAYLDSARAALRVGGHLVMAVFGLGGPDRCSGLPVEQYDAEKLGGSLGPEFQLVRSLRRQHLTPGGATQEFVHAVLRRLR